MPATAAALEAVIDLPTAVRSVPAARRLVAPLLTAWAAESLYDDTVLLLSELVTNVVRHVAGPTCLKVDIHLDDTVLRVGVIDTSTTHPTVGDHAAGNGGHGMQLIARLAQRWGTEDHDTGKRVWFELDRNQQLSQAR